MKQQQINGTGSDSLGSLHQEIGRDWILPAESPDSCSFLSSPLREMETYEGTNSKSVKVLTLGRDRRRAEGKETSWCKDMDPWKVAKWCWWQITLYAVRMIHSILRSGITLDPKSPALKSGFCLSWDSCACASFQWAQCYLKWFDWVSTSYNQINLTRTVL